MTLCYMMLTRVVSIGEDRLSKIPSQQPYMIYKVDTSENFDYGKVTDSLNELNKHMKKSFNEITVLLREYLLVK